MMISATTKIHRIERQRPYAAAEVFAASELKNKLRPAHMANFVLSELATKGQVVIGHHQYRLEESA